MSVNISGLNKTKYLIIIFSVCFLFSSCAVKTDPITGTERNKQIKKDIKKLYKDQKELNKPLTIYEAMARTVKYNLEYRIKIMEEALAAGEKKISGWGMIPELAASAGYNYRSEYQATGSENLITGRESLPTSISQDKKMTTGSLDLVWNVLDFGVSYFQTKQDSDRKLIAQEKRRKVIHNLISEARSAYWQAASASLLKDKVKNIVKEAEASLVKLEKVRKEKLKSPIESLMLEKALITTIKQMNAILAKLDKAKKNLASLMNLPPDQDLKLAADKKMMKKLPELKLEKNRMEKIALKYRPELMETAYQSKISEIEIKKAMVRMLPGIEFKVGKSYTSNSFAAHNNWWEAGMQLTWNIFGLFSAPEKLELAKSRKDLSIFKRLSMSMAVLTQVHISASEFESAKKDYYQDRRLWNIEEMIQSQVTARRDAESTSEISKVRSKAETVRAELTMYRSYAKMENAIGSIYSTLGLDPLPLATEDMELETLTDTIKNSLTSWENKYLKFKSNK